MRHPLNNVQGLAWGILPYPEDITTQDGNIINNSRVRHDIFTKINEELRMYDLIIWVNGGRYLLGKIQPNLDWKIQSNVPTLQAACVRALRKIEDGSPAA